MAVIHTGEVSLKSSAQSVWCESFQVTVRTTSGRLQVVCRLCKSSLGSRE